MTTVCITVALCVAMVCTVWIKDRELQREEARDTSLTQIREALKASERRYTSDLEQLGTTLGEVSGRVQKMQTALSMKRGK